MLTLCLLRHAKSSWNDPSIQDIDRPLAPRGEAAAPRMGSYMAAHNIAPQLVLCSPAVRTRRTLQLVLAKLPNAPAVAYEEALYLAAPSTLLARIRKVQANIRSLLIVGHDPGMHGLAIDLSGSGDMRDLQRLSAKFPTAGLAVITFETDGWSGIGPKSGRLEQFMAPKLLDD